MDGSNGKEDDAIWKFSNPMIQERDRTRPVYSVLIVVSLFFLSILYSNIFPGNFGVGIVSQDKPVILYFDYLEQPFQPSNFSNIVSFASSHGFNTLMIVVYINHKQIFNDTVLQDFYTYARSQNVTFVPSFYIMSSNDSFDARGFNWINLDMERLSSDAQSAFFSSVNQNFSLVSVTMPYGAIQTFYTKMLIVETYDSLPKFWLDQLLYSHGGTICSVHVRFVHSESDYRQEFQYCFRYSDGGMVFAYPQLEKAGYT